MKAQASCCQGLQWAITVVSDTVTLVRESCLAESKWIGLHFSWTPVVTFYFYPKVGLH